MPPMAAAGSLLERLALWTVACLTAVGMGLAVHDARLFRRYTSETGPIENLTVVMLLAAAVVCFRRAWRLRGRRSALFLTATVLLGLLFVAAAGEELSWGQRFLGYKAPEFFRSHNAQRETNLHNMVVKGVKISLLIFVLAYCAILPVAYRRWAGLRRLADALAVPVPRTRHIVWYAVLALGAYVTPSKFLWEVLELVTATMFCLFTALPLNADAFQPDPLPPLRRGPGEGR
jgi:hypothetical protein